MNKVRQGSSKTGKRLLAAMLAVVMVLGMIATAPVASAKGKKPLFSVSLEPFCNELNEVSKKKVLYVGMKWSPRVTYKYADSEDDSEDDEHSVSITESVGTLAGVRFASSNEKVAAINKKGVITAKKAGTAKITINSSELTKTFTVKVLAYQKVSKKKLVSEKKRSKNDYNWPVIVVFDKKDDAVKKGYVKVGKEYQATLYSVRTYKQKDGSKRSTFAYTVKGSKNASYKYEIPLGEFLAAFQLCEGVESWNSGKGDGMGSFVKENWPGWQSMPGPSYMGKAERKQMQKYARENIYTSDEVYYKAIYNYGWRNMCAS